MKAYITLLSTDEYLDGVLALYQSLCNVGSQYPLVVALTKNISPFVREILQKLRIELIEIENFEYSDSAKKRMRAVGMPHWINTSCKLRIFGLTDFEKLIFLDSDMLVLKNIDHLFEKPAFTAAVDSPMIAEEDKKEHNQLNSGLLVIEPNKEIEKQLLETASITIGADQDIIRNYYKNWINEEELHLPVTYNYFAFYYDRYEKVGIKLSQVYVLHFIGKVKPFMKNSILKEKNSYLKYMEELYLDAINGAISQLEKFDKNT